ncbi:MAG: O-antigen ligase family protein [Candidatus Curtissbacteria bacterium]|nr:O-antigen ligase family protein [Candidatus Curtissbacteria bacterium]
MKVKSHHPTIPLSFHLSDLLFLTTIAIIPIQLGKYFFSDSSYVLGIPIDYRAASIYLSDIVVSLFIPAFLWENRKNLKSIWEKYKSFISVLLVLNLYLIGSSLLTSNDNQISIIFNLKTLTFSMFAIFAAHSLSKKKIREMALLVITVTSAVESLVIFAQFALQKSLGLWILGERAFDSTTPLIAHLQFLGNQLLRPYGTFPHPNVAGAYLSFSLILLIGSQFRRKTANLLPLVISTLALTLTFSRTAIIASIVGLVIIANKFKFTTLLLLIAIIAGTTLIISQSLDVAPIAERLTLAQAALNITLLNPLFGVGSNNFILELSRLNLFALSETRLLQPAHNVFLLILAENGIVGLLLFATLLLVISKSINDKIKLALFAAILIFSTTDHFLWTLQQGRLMFWFAAAYIVSQEK